MALGACTRDRTPELIGTWQARYLLEQSDSSAQTFGAGDTVDVRLDDVSLRFDEGGRYVYTSTLDYYEEGAFKLKGEYLTTTPDADSVGVQRVRVTALDQDRLQFYMLDAGRRRQLGFARVDSVAPE